MQDSVGLRVRPEDQAGDRLTYSATGLPPGVTIDPATGKVGGIIDTTGPAVYPVVVTVSDGSLSDSKGFPWAVRPDGRSGRGTR